MIASVAPKTLQTPRRRFEAGVRMALWFLGVGVAIGLMAPLLSQWFGLDPSAIDRACMRGCAPSLQHWFGTDSLGRDVAAQLMYGTQTALLGGLAAALLAGVVGFGLGAGAAWLSRAGASIPAAVLATAALGLGGIAYCVSYFPEPGGWVVFLIAATGSLVWWISQLRRFTSWGVRADRLLLYGVEVTSSVPALLLLLALTALALRPGLVQLVLVYVGFVTARLAALSLQEVRNQLSRPYVEAAHFAGVPAWRLLLGHILPNVLPPFAVELVLTAAGFVLLEGTFSFLGLGLPPTTPSWGHLLAETRSAQRAWWLWVFPGLALVGTVLSLQTLSKALRGWRSGH